MDLEGRQLGVLSQRESVDRMSEEIHQGIWARRTSTKGHQPLTGSAYLAHVPLRHVALVQLLDQLAVGVSPALFAVLDHDGHVNWRHLLRQCGQLLYILALNREANAGATHQYIQDLIEYPRVIDSSIATVEPSHVGPIETRTGTHHAPHRWHDLEVQDSLPDLVLNVTGLEEIQALHEDRGDHIGNVAIDSLVEGLPAVQGVHELTVTGLVNK